MKTKLILSALLLLHTLSLGATKTLWQIGAPDGSCNELALAPNKYADFLGHDFGWEDKSFIIGINQASTHFPYILPGPYDTWGGTSGTAGLRTHVLNVMFSLSQPGTGNYSLIVDLLDVNNQHPTLLKVSVNGKDWKYALPKGSGMAATGDVSQAKPYSINIPLDATSMRKVGNTISIAVLEGSWVVFDDVRLVAPDDAQLAPACKSAFLRNVTPANYTTPNPQAQPLLVDVEHLSGEPLLEVKLDGKSILKQKLECGRYVFEAPMPTVNRPTQSTYTVSIDGKVQAQGFITRSKQPVATPASYIDTRIGTAHSRWMIAPGPWMPFSMVKLSPDNQNAGWQAGYQPSFESIGTFSHVHEWTMGGLGIMPVNGTLRTRIGDQSSLANSQGYRSAIDKQSEVAEAGYYKVQLTDYDITAELTATTRCALQRYTFPSDKDARVMIDLMIPCEYSYQIIKGSLRQTGPRRIEGYCKQISKEVWSTDADQKYTLHFVIEFNKDIKRFGGWCNNELWQANAKTATNPQDFGCYAEFSTTDGNQVMVRSAISYVDIDGASRNLAQEIANPFGWDFDAVVNYNRSTWDNLLSRATITSNDRREKTRFYTNMYRAFCRNTFSDVDARWRDASGQIRRLESTNDAALGCDAFWNTFWNLNQLWNLIAPEWSERWVRSQLAMYDAHQWLAKGPAGMQYIPVMVAEHEIPLLVSAYQMGIRNYDANRMLQACVKMQTTPATHVAGGFAGNRDLVTYLKHHYVPADEGRFSNSLEYSFDDWTVSQLAKSLNNTEVYNTFANRGTWWKNAINPQNGYAHLRNSNGEWQADFDPFKSGANHHYVEGNAWQLTFFVPQDVPALINAIGKDRFIDRLTWGFEASEPWRYNAPGDQYWDYPVVQGNQQSMHFAFLFNWAGQPWQTQRWSRSIIDRYYGFEVANAYLGDEDQGQMSAWFVMAAIGLFQTDGGCNANPCYEITSPLFKQIEIDLGNQYGRGKKFVIKANNVSRKNIYIQSATLNGEPLNSFKFPASQLLNGGTLLLEMGSTPNKQWGVD
ncbi:MAG: GH92 family glycosyl hydrolase [Muribaculaceae bacterium]